MYSDARNVYAKEQGEKIASQLKSMAKSGFQKKQQGLKVKRCFGEVYPDKSGLSTTA